MWFGLLYAKPPEGQEDLAYTLVYEHHRIYTGGGRLGDGLTVFAWAWRQAAADVGGAEGPRCPHCETPMDVPFTDVGSSACASS